MTISSLEIERLRSLHYQELLDPIPEDWGFLDENLSVVRCAECREPWGESGCSTRRLIDEYFAEFHARLTAQDAERQAVWERREARAALAELGTEWKVRRPSEDPGHRSLTIKYLIAEEALAAGRGEVVDYSLQQIRNELLRQPVFSGAEREARLENELGANITRFVDAPASPSGGVPPKGNV